MLLINSGANGAPSVYIEVFLYQLLFPNHLLLWSSLDFIKVYVQLCFKAQHGQNSLLFVINAN